jgi:molybdopterin synthase catalytic subunit
MTGAQIRTLLESRRIDPQALACALAQNALHAGAVVTFSGHVRQDQQHDPVIALELEHYPGQTERDLAALAEDAAQRWSLQALTIVHRVGRIPVRECIVWVGVATSHRAAAYAANEYIMDALKTRVMLWKRECRAQSQRWLSASEDDRARAARWQKKGPYEALQ